MQQSSFGQDSSQVPAASYCATRAVSSCKVYEDTSLKDNGPGDCEHTVFKGMKSAKGKILNTICIDLDTFLFSFPSR